MRQANLSYLSHSLKKHSFCLSQRITILLNLGISLSRILLIDRSYPAFDDFESPKSLLAKENHRRVIDGLNIARFVNSKNVGIAIFLAQVSRALSIGDLSMEAVEKKFDCVKLMRRVRDELSEEVASLSTEERVLFFANKVAKREGRGREKAVEKKIIELICKLQTLENEVISNNHDAACKISQAKVKVHEALEVYRAGKE